MIQFVKFESLGNVKHYTIHLLLNENKSFIYKYHDRDGYFLLISFDKLLNITPETLSSKLKTYLLFL